MKKNKTIAYALAATLLVGGTFLGTKALFTDKIDTVGELSISTGDVDIDAEVVQDWTLDRNGEEDGKGTNTQDKRFDNLKTGDVLKKTVKIKNQGSLYAKLIMEKNDIKGKLPNGIEFSAKRDGKDIGDNYTVDLAPNIKNHEKDSFIQLDLQIEVVGTKDGDSLHSETDKTLNSNAQESEIIQLKDTYTINAKQINEREIN